LSGLTTGYIAAALGAPAEILAVKLDGGLTTDDPFDAN
jgi:hypothetical protein